MLASFTSLEVESVPTLILKTLIDSIRREIALETHCASKSATDRNKTKLILGWSGKLDMHN